MRNIIIGLLFCSVCFNVSQVCVAARLQLPNNTETVLVNGKASQQSSVKLDLTTPDAIQQIAFRYQARYRDNGSQNHFTSDVIILRFTASEQTYTVALPTINSTSRANQFNAHPAITLTNQAGDKVAFTQDKLMKAGLQIGRDFEQEMTLYNTSGAIAAMATNTKLSTVSNTEPGAVVMTPSMMPAATVKGEQAVNNTAAKPLKKTDDITQAEVSRMLDYWYQKANQQTQAEFKAKINN
ncbi:DUF2057 domain-containing protein [Shewanella polaris]|uniref:DUF2057 domain-containing protein n=1 Tax=Shewanella polaris TaxID=2588449 RepID=A0A4Y5YIB1_9GAMM|nr:DUF2057 domain-containing protein [Shewanella polaris]QDE32338.1 DUF2057 domain-containing protein [Shewanella polaris]